MRKLSTNLCERFCISSFFEFNITTAKMNRIMKLVGPFRPTNGEILRYRRANSNPKFLIENDLNKSFVLAVSKNESARLHKVSSKFSLYYQDQFISETVSGCFREMIQLMTIKTMYLGTLLKTLFRITTARIFGKIQ